MKAAVARIDFTSQRLFVDAPLQAGAAVPLDRGQANYLVNVLRFAPGDAVLVFNGRDGEWRASVSMSGRKAASLTVEARTRVQPAAGQLTYAFAPLKQARLDYMVQKAVEMGAGCLQPVVTRHTQVVRLNLDRVRSNAVEAAEQCGILALPGIGPVLRFDRWLAELPGEAPLIFCDEDADVADPDGLVGPERRGRDDRREPGEQAEPPDPLDEIATAEFPIPRLHDPSLPAQDSNRPIRRS